MIDKYILEEMIGEGQFGEVFKSRDKNTNQLFAIKCIKRRRI